MKKTFLVITAITVAFCVNAQFREETSADKGIEMTTDALGNTTLRAHFNTTNTKTVTSGSSKERQQGPRGQLVNVYNELNGIIWPKDNDTRINNINSNGNNMMADSLGCIIDFYSATGSPAMSSAHGFWYPTNAFILKDKTLADGITDRTTLAGADRVFAVYPGMYKSYAAMFGFNLEGKSAVTDIEFEMYTLDKGTAGGTATYDLWLGLGTGITSNNIDTTKMTVVRGVYTSGEAQKTIKIANTFGLNISDLSNYKVYFAISTNGTGTAMNPMQYDPVIAFDNFTVTYASPAWINPVAVANEEVNNMANMAENISLVDNTAVFPLDLEMTNRVKNMTVTLDIESSVNPETAQLRIKGAQSWNGSAWVDIADATLTAPTTEDGESWSKEKITIPAGDGSQEKIRILLSANATGKADGDLCTQKFEIDNGVRIWYNYFGTFNMTPTSLLSAAIGTEQINIFSEQGKIFVQNTTESVTVYGLDGKVLQSVSGTDAASGIIINAGTYLVTAGNVSEKLIVK